MKHEWNQFFDDPNLPMDDAQDQELAELFREVCEQDYPEPGSNYWNQFNARLQHRMGQQSGKPAWWNLKVFFTGMVLVSAVMFLCVFSLSIWNANKTEKDQFQLLADLSPDDLTLLSDMMPLAERDLLTNSSAWVEDEALDDLYDDSDTMYLELDSIDPQALESLFNKEG